MLSAEPALPVLFIPGTLCSADVFAALTNVLEPERVRHADITLDSAVGECARRLLAIAPDRFIAVGFSLGAIVALELAAIAPDRVAALGLIAGNARAVPATDHAARRAAVAGVAAGRLVGHDLWPRSVHPQQLDNEALRARIVAMAEGCPPGTAARQTELALSRGDSRPRLATMTMPALVLSGAQDQIAPAEVQAELAHGLPNGQWTQVAEAGHFLLLERPDACAAVFSRWLTQVDLDLSGARARVAPDSIACNVPEVS